jgi:hypothetical protein
VISVSLAIGTAAISATIFSAVPSLLKRFP